LFTKVLIANRGVVACRIIRTLRKLKISLVAVYSEADAGALHVELADEAVCIGPAPAAQSYLNAEAILNAALKTGAQAVHPGYGFLSENPDFAAACEAAGLVFLGPTPEQIRSFGLKNTARDIAIACSAPILPGTGLLRDAEHAAAEAARIGYPVMLKSAGGGGGIGMRLCGDEAELRDAYQSVLRLSETHFKGSGIYLEKFVARGRHIEVQVFGDGQGQVIALGERDCSVQRRNQKVVEETPAPFLAQPVREHLLQVAVGVMQSVSYRSAGTVEFIYDTDTEQFYFLEVNTRLQVEHGVTEEVTGIDLVEWMVRLGDGSLPPVQQLGVKPQGASIQVRVYAENPLQDFQPSSGRITEFVPPPETRCETWIETGSEVTPFYDPLLAKLIVRGETRAEALQKLQHAIAETRLSGIETNLSFLQAVAADSRFVEGGVTTRFLNDFSFKPLAVRVVEPGVLTIMQEYPGRLGYWAVGVPPSGPMDSLSFRLGNQLLGNPAEAPGLECTLSGPSLQFLHETQIVIAGADMQPKLDGVVVPLWTVVDVAAGSTLQLGPINGSGARAYLLVKGGFDAPRYLGSATTFTLGKFGGTAGRQLRTGDILPLKSSAQSAGSKQTLPEEARPALTKNWTIGVLYGPHGAPDFFTAEDIDTFFSTSWRVHHNSSRTGVRLIGPKPRWAREDGGEAGLHPSNIHDNAYAIGSVDFTGDMPVLLGPDGPSLGGFVCPAVIADAELWKMGQLSPGDTVRFVRLTAEAAASLELAVEQSIQDLASALPAVRENSGTLEPAVLRQNTTLAYTCRAAGDKYLLIEFGQPVLDLALRFRVHALMEALEQNPVDGIIDLTPGIRSLQIHYNSRILSRDQLLKKIELLVSSLPSEDNIAVPTRIVHLPLSWDDPATQLAIQRYMTSVRPDAPWCPSNLEFIRRINGLDSIEDVHKIVFNANYLVLGLGDVYLGAPVATPTDPRHRLVTTKYNPARTWTPENAVGIGGAYLCVYGMEGPGGYQFVGRTVQMWNTYKATADFEAGKPWLLRFFDQIRFYPVGAEELLHMRREFPLGRLKLNIEHEQFRLSDYRKFLRSISSETEVFRARQSAAFAAERARWAAQGEFTQAEEADAGAAASADHDIPPGCVALRSPTTASVWKLETGSGNAINSGQRVFILEAMKMEIAVLAPQDGEVVEVLCQPGAMVTAGQPLLVYRPQEEKN
jgi:urea carboxylase